MKRNHFIPFVLFFTIICIIFSSCAIDLPPAENTTKTNTANQSDVYSLNEEGNPKASYVKPEKNTNTSSLSKEQTSSEDSSLNELYCSLSIRCDSVLKKLDKLPDNKKQFIPNNGIIYQNNKVPFSDGESVFDVLCRELNSNNIPFEYTENNMFNSTYIKGIGNLNEFDAGSNSGWLYTINGKSPTIGCSQSLLESEDKIEFYYI